CARVRGDVAGYFDFW
nr:immunoglobulin heavy chain junction region [Macaca mulatta]MOW78587.1 immunoglobulin heavy chain junction region [Macaca mulatta]MOW84223.1 immunoglobulin heavy chain junction region [Macaca mulatta]